MHPGSKRCFFFPPSSKCWETTWLITWELPGRRVLDYRVFWTLVFVLCYKRAHRKRSASKRATAPPVLYPIPRRTRKKVLRQSLLIAWSHQAWRRTFSLLLLPAFSKSDLESCSQRDPEENPESKIFNLQDPCPLMKHDNSMLTKPWCLLWTGLGLFSVRIFTG